MPKEPDIRRVLIIGSGPIVIGQACEFDYSGTQACKALREEGIGVVLLNSNPATIMTDPEVADRTYIEPILPETIEKVLEREQANNTPIDCVLPTLGGQTGLNCAVEAEERGILKKYNVRMIGADREAIHRAEDRTAFKQTIETIGLDLPRSGVAHSIAEAEKVLEDVKLPCCIRPAYTLGGAGGGFVKTMEEFQQVARLGLDLSRVSEILIEESLWGWKEYELEVMRDRNDNVVVICSIENMDAMGVHTGDSITVAPAMTLTDREYQDMRDAAIKIIRAVGVETGGSNVQFGVCPDTGRMVVIEMNPRVSRSSALASKATGFPIAKVATKLAIGYTLDEIPNDITKETLACFEPTLDYVVTKMPRWAFEKFPDADETLNTHMKSVGEAMSIGRTFKESFQKCVRSMEIKRFGYGLDGHDKWLRNLRKRQNGNGSGNGGGSFFWVDETGAQRESSPEVYFGSTNLGEAPHDAEEESAVEWPLPDDVLTEKISVPCQGRIYYVRYALKLGWSIEKIYELSGIDPWFLSQFKELVDFEDELIKVDLSSPAIRPDAKVHDLYNQAKMLGYSDVQLANAWNIKPSSEVFAELRRHRPVYKLVDTCSAEFEAYTPYYYSAFESPVSTVINDPEAVEALKQGAGVDGTGHEKVRSAIAQHDIKPPYGFRPLDNENFIVTALDDEIRVTEKPKVVILGGGPNRIGQGIEFDYCCVHASQAAKELEYETVMINSNPETVSTDFDTSDLLFFEPLTLADVLNVCERLNGRPFEPGNPGSGLVKGIIVQFGGQTPLNLAEGLEAAGAPIIGTSPRSIHLVEEREHFGQIVNELGLMQPPNGIATSLDEALGIAERIGYPIIVRPSYVLGGRAMEVCNNADDLARYAATAWDASDRNAEHGAVNPILIDKFLLDAVEIDVDAISDYGQQNPHDVPRCDVCGIMEHIEEAGVHSGDSCCTLPPYSLSPSVLDEITYQVKLLARRLGVCGLMNAQFAIHERVVYLLEVNPRASRTVPFVSKATGVPWAKVATKVMLGLSVNEALAEAGITSVWDPNHISVKAPVFPFHKFRGVDAVLGPEMKSTGEVMGMDKSYPLAFAKAMLAAGITLPTEGTALVSTNDPDKPRVVSIARELHELGFKLYSTIGTHHALAEGGVPSEIVSKHPNDKYPFLLDMIHGRELDLLINTPIHKGAAWEEGRWRAACVQEHLPLITNLAGAKAAVGAIRALKQGDWPVAAVQDYVGRGKPA